MIQLPASVRTMSGPEFPDVERRAAERHSCNVEAVSCPLEAPEDLCWGANVRDISTGGIGLTLCYPFKPGTFLAITLHVPEKPRTLLGRVIHVSDQTDGTWFIGCEFLKELDGQVVEQLI